MIDRKHILAPEGSEALRRKKENLIRRSQIIQAIRNFFQDGDFIEVDTPVRIPAPAPEFQIDAEPSGERFLITSPELQMKRLLQAGYSPIFQLCRCFRRHERGERHLPEFTMLEWYRLDGDTRTLMRDTEALVNAVASRIGQYPTLMFQGTPIDLSPPFEVIEVQDAFLRYAGWRPGSSPDPDRFDFDLVDKVEPSLPPDRPVFLTGYPASLASLARIDPENFERAERFELYAGGLELANGFAELTCPTEQRRRFEKESAQRKRAGKVDYPLDEHFLSALEAGLSPCAGIALGVDRLVMLLLDCSCIDDVVAFPEGTF